MCSESTAVYITTAVFEGCERVKVIITFLISMATRVHNSCALAVALLFPSLGQNC